MFGRRNEILMFCSHDNPSKFRRYLELKCSEKWTYVNCSTQRTSKCKSLN